MKITLTDESIVRSPKTLTSLLQRRITLIWNHNVSNLVTNVIFKSMPNVPYEIISNGNNYNIYFSNDVLLELVHSTKGISDFDNYLIEIENRLIWKL